MRHKSEELMKQIMDYAEQFQLLNHRSPYTSEIADALGIVKSTVYKYLVAMNDRGMLSYRNGRLLLRERIKYLYLRSRRQYLGQYPVVCRSWRKSILRNMFLFLFHYLERVSSLSCGPVEIL